jgi:hypothetical protein
MVMLHESTSSSSDDEDRRAPGRPANSFHMPPRPVEFLHLVEKKDDDDDEDEDDDQHANAALFKRGDIYTTEDEPAEPKSVPPAEFAAPFVELPLDINVPAQESVEPLPLDSAQEATAEDDDSRSRADHRRVFLQPTAKNPKLSRMDDLNKLRTDFIHDTPIVPLQNIVEAPAAESVVLEAAEQTVASAPTEQPPAPEVHASIPANPNPNVIPPNHNVVPPQPPTPNAPPQPPAGGNLPPNRFYGNASPPPPFHNVNNTNGAPNTPPTPNFNVQPGPTPIIIEREHTVERQGGELWGKLAMVGLLLEHRGRKGADSKLEKQIVENQEEIVAMGESSARQAEMLRNQRRQATITEQRTTQLEKNATVQQRAAEAVGAGIRPPEVIRPTTTAERPPTPHTEVAEEVAIEPGSVEPGKVLRADAWRNTVMRHDSAGREVVDTSVEYGQAYRQERNAETAATQVAHSDAQLPGGASTHYPTTTSASAPLPGGFNPSLPSGMSTPSLPGGATYQDPEHLLPAPRHRGRDAATTAFLWILVALVAFAAVSGARLLF